MSLLNNYNWAYFNTIDKLSAKRKYDIAKDLIILATTRFQKEKLPFTSDEAEKYFTEMTELLEKK